MEASDFLIQNSWSYDTIDFIRELDIETYKMLEKG